jgi:hypothetical protein
MKNELLEDLLPAPYNAMNRYVEFKIGTGTGSWKSTVIIKETSVLGAD